MRKNHLVLVFSLFIVLMVSAFPVFSQNNGVDVEIRFFNKKLYTPDHRITVKIMVTNNSSETFRFKLADERAFNIDFEVNTLSNRKVSSSEQLIIVRNSNQPTFFRDISLGPGEQFSFFETLNEYVNITNPGSYTVQAVFYPELIRPGSIGINMRSNRLSLSVRPGTTEKAFSTMEDEAVMAGLEKKNLAPDEVVEWTLRNRQQSNWDEFFLYLNVESLLKKDDARERKYNMLSQEEQRRMLQEYKEDLQSQTVDGDIIVIPDEFTIIKTEYTPEEASVRVEEKFHYSNYKEVKEYIYYLRKRDNVWFIYDYSVRNVRTE